MATKGPPPKRSDQRRRRNKPDENELHIVQIPGSPARPPAADPNWHPLAHDWYESLKQSGQCAFYQASDWQFARLTAELLSKELRARTQRAQMLDTLFSAMGNLLTSEGERRRLRVELMNDNEDESRVQEQSEIISMYQTRFNQGG